MSYFSCCSTRQWTRHTRNCSLFPTGARDVSLLQNVQTSSGTHIVSYSMEIRGSFSGNKVAKPSHPYIAKVKNKWSYTSIPPHAFTLYTATSPFNILVLFAVNHERNRCTLVHRICWKLTEIGNSHKFVVWYWTWAFHVTIWHLNTDAASSYDYN